jgi:Fic family protein
METVQRIEPARLDDVPEHIANLVAELSAAASKLEHSLAPRTALSLAEMVRIMNTYYSNLIEGHQTRPKDIEQALHAGRQSAANLPETIHIEQAVAGTNSIRSADRDLLKEAVAHVRIQAQIDAAYASSGVQEPAEGDFIKRLHREFYLGASPSMLRISGAGREFQMVPGEWRSETLQDVAVGMHQPPSSARVEDFMRYFSERYRFAPLGKAGRILAMPAAHHRFNYIHPFPDGNGRVSRLMSHAMAHAAGIGAHGLWSVSRGLARGLESRNDYKRMMAHADMPRQGDLDGRGNLSQRALVDFTAWFLKVCLDQVEFMSELFQLGSLSKRLRRCVEADIDLRPEAGRLLDEALVRGSFDRGDASRISGLPERTARRVLAELVQSGLLASDSPKSPVFLRFPMRLQDVLFPRLFGET